MKLSATLALSAVLGVTSARNVLVAEEQAVSPMTFANCGKPSDAAVVENISLSPNPPQLYYQRIPD
jgi:hypothetical protein